MHRTEWHNNWFPEQLLWWRMSSVSKIIADKHRGTELFSDSALNLWCMFSVLNGSFISCCEAELENNIVLWQHRTRPTTQKTLHFTTLNTPHKAESVILSIGTHRLLSPTHCTYSVTLSQQLIGTCAGWSVHFSIEGSIRQNKWMGGPVMHTVVAP